VFLVPGNAELSDGEDVEWQLERDGHLVADRNSTAWYCKHHGAGIIFVAYKGMR
jgi:hypothetical protein